jgi:uncharacterized protein YjbI with pentapeptide repeats/beta-lactamase regulating signal transducer with metallopeptidase domain
MTLPLPVALAIFAVWSLLAMFSFLKLAIGLYRLEQLKRDALPLPVEYRDAMARWTEVNKGSREVRLCVSDEIDVPVAVGLFDAMILIPRALMERLSEAEVDQISLHELAHLRRADDWTNGLQRIAIALFAWNPAVQFIGQQLDLEREVACDDWVLTLTGLVRPYALCLTKMAETSSWPHRPMPAPGVFATRKHISLRIERLLGAGRNVATNLSFGPAAATLAIVGALAFAMQLVAPSIAAPVETAKQDAASTVSHAWTPPAKPKENVRYVYVPLPSVHAPAMHESAPATNESAPAANASLASVPLGLSSMRAAQSAAAKIRANIATSVGAGLNPMRVADASSVRACTGCDMSGVNWAGRDMHGVNYSGVDLSRANLANTNFSGGSFSGVDFSHSNLHGASFRNARLTGCDFSNANLTGVDFSGTTMEGCQFTGAQLSSADIRSILNTCTGCDFGHANLSGLDLSHVRTTGIDFSNANLSGANLSDAQFTGADFSGARLDGANLTNTVFNGCDLGRVDLTHVDLSKAKLIGTDLSARGSPRP